ncbi:unnamed protein product [Arctogadus glacialis]
MTATPPDEYNKQDLRRTRPSEKTTDSLEIPLKQRCPFRQQFLRVPGRFIQIRTRSSYSFRRQFFTLEVPTLFRRMYGCEWDDEDERPRVSLLQRSPSSPVVCHATGFYPNRVVMFWRRDGQELHEQVDPGEVLPNHDGTFQVSVDLDLTAVPQEDWGRYECVVQLRGIEDISTPLDPAHIRTNRGDNHILAFILTGVAVVAAVAAVVGVFLYQKRNDSEKRHKPVDSDSSSENTEGQKLAPEAQPLTTGQS